MSDYYEQGSQSAVISEFTEELLDWVDERRDSNETIQES